MFPNSFFTAYLLGGITFPPLFVLGILCIAWLLTPKVEFDNSVSTVKKSHGTKNEDERDADGQSRHDSLQESAANGTFAVLRRYDLQAAVTALNSRNGNVNTNTSSYDGTTNSETSSASSESVYQTMYRQVFDRNRNTSNARSLLEDTTVEQASSSRSGKSRSIPANILYVTLRHGHLMLYDSPAQIEVKHVISLAHHAVTLQAGDGTTVEDTHEMIAEADLFVKRTAIVLTPIADSTRTFPQRSEHGQTKPFFFFSSNGIEKEDFYHALVASRPPCPLPLDLDAAALIKLQSALHSSSLTPETRALNAIIGRVFLALQRSDSLSSFIRGKIEKKLVRISKPSFIPSLEIKSLNIGDAGPVLSNLKLKDFNISGDLTVSVDMRYTGCLSITLLAVAKLDLGARFKTRTVDVMLKTTVQRIAGPMLLRIKPAPSNRLWFCFENSPDMDIRVEPIVSDRKITYGFILRAIEERIRTAIGEGLVHPNWDDMPMPLMDTRGGLRGGLWQPVDTNLAENALAHSSHHPLAARNNKTKSMPALADNQDHQTLPVDFVSSSDIDLSRSSSSSTTDQTAFKRRSITRSTEASNTSASSTPEKAERTSSIPRPLRSPSFATAATSPPVVAVDNVESIRADDAAYQAAGLANRRSWLLRGSPQNQPQQRDAFEELKGVHARAENAESRSIVSSLNSESSLNDTESIIGSNIEENPAVHRRQTSDTSMGSTSGFRLGRADTGLSTSSTSRSQQNFQQRKTNILAATAAATNAAKTWSWNAYQRGKAATAQAQARREAMLDKSPSQPMGRGQPLPPPGVPLPGPQKTGWGNSSATRRKPVPSLPPRREQQSDESMTTSVFNNDTETQAESTHSNDDFGPWRQNSGDDSHEREAGELGEYDHDEYNDNEYIEASHSGLSNNDANAVHEDGLPHDRPASLPTRRTGDVSHPDAETTPKKPPPLPARRPDHGLGESSAESRSESANEQEENQATVSDDGDSALHVPAEAINAVAAENATEELAHGKNDDSEHIDVAQGVHVESVQPPGHIEHQQQSQDLLLGDDEDYEE